MLQHQEANNKAENDFDEASKMIDNYKQQQTLRKAEKIYKEIGEDDKRLAEEFLSICAIPTATYKEGREKGGDEMKQPKKRDIYIH